jgi:formylglycine-generating enzyme required for sulfatase activity
VGRLWDVLGDAQAEPDQRFRAACALATYDPAGGDGGQQGWAGVSPFVAERLLLAVQQNPSQFTPLLAILRPVRDALIPPLSAAYRSRESGESERSWAANVLADYCANEAHVGVLADLLLDGDEKQFAVLYPRLKERGERGLPPLASEIDKKPPSDAKDEAREKLAKRQANAAVALLRMNRPATVWPLLKHSPDPRARSYLIHRLSPLGADAGAIRKRLDEEPDVTIRRALLLSLGEFDEKALPPEARRALLPRLQEMYRTAPDPGLHAAAEWLLRQWREEAWLAQTDEAWAKDKGQREKRLEGIRQELVKEQEKAPPQWYVNGQGQTLVVVPGPVEFLMGSPPAEEGRMPHEQQHRSRIGRTFALAAKPVTVREFRRFLKENKLEAWFDVGGQAAAMRKKCSPDEHGPIILVDWYKAAAYCNWLSKQEGIPEPQWCYRTDPQGQVTALQAQYLSLQGYRLPTGAEWEYACRAGAVTSRYYGETEELLPRYAWYLKNSGERSWPAGKKKPNDLGLFDMHGNVRTWCQESFQGDYPAAKEGERIDDNEGGLIINSEVRRVVPGGSFLDQASYLRCSGRSGFMPTFRNDTAGLRPARTFAP